MRIAHVADLHLGFSQFQVTNDAGVNVRERDVETAAFEVAAGIIDAEVDLVIVAGDMLHRKHPSNRALRAALSWTKRVSRYSPVLVVGGNHDVPQDRHGCALELLLYADGGRGVDVTWGGARTIRYGDVCAVHCVPYAALGDPNRLACTATDLPAILVLHGDVETPDWSPPHGHESGPAVPVALSEIHEAGPWAYVALGHYHEQRELAPNVWYAGSPERTTSNVWQETGPFGWLLVTVSPEHGTTVEPQTTLPRDMHDIEIGASGASVEEITARLLAGTLGASSNSYARITISDVPKTVARQIPPEAIDVVRRRFLHLQLRFEHPEDEQLVVATSSTTEAAVAARLESYTPPAGVDGDRVREVVRTAISEEGGDG